MTPQLKMELSLTMLMALLSACSPKAAYAEVPPPTPAPTFAADVEPDAADQKVEAVSNEEAQAQDAETVKITDQLYVTLEGGLQAAGIATDETTKDKYELVAGGDSGKLWYASIKNRETGAIVAVVDGSRQWTTDLTQAVQVETVNVIDQLATAYLNGEIDNVGDLSSAELAEFSKKVTEKKNADRGINVLIFDDGTGNPAFIDPNHDNKMMEYDGNADLSKTIEMFVPIAGYDEQGNLQFEVDGQIVTIGASAGVKWGAPITEYGDPRIEWPVGTDVSKTDGMTTPERAMNNKEYSTVLLPAVLLDKNPGQIYITGSQSTLRSTFRFLVPEADSAGHPLYAREILITGAVTFRMYEEGTNLELRTGATELATYEKFIKELSENWTYYLGCIVDQDYIYGKLNNEHLDHYQGLVSTTDATPVLLGEKQNDQDMLSIATTMIIKAKVK